ncbi:transposase, partial [Streptomyces sp. NPDC002215]|uniref:transposase n=1 Tax=Streptomyces sp. NPDC002215 TaxID=3154412 RepID=UPI00331FF580
MQFVEGLSDRQAAHAVRSRIDWKFALALELEDTGFDFSVLSEFRTRLADGEAGRVVFDAVLEAAGGAGLLKTAGRQRTDSTHVLAATHALNRLELVVETLRAALNEIAQASGDWLAVHARSDWFDRYTSRPEDRRFPTRWAARIEHGDEAGTDGSALLTALWSPSAPPGLRALPQVELLRRVWVQQFQYVDGCVKWREPKNLPPARIRYCAPYDLDARTGAKADRAWDGFKVHLTETCEPDAPHLVTNVETTVASVSDMEMTPVIHNELAARGGTPNIHLVDAGYVDAHNLATARHDHGVSLLGPVKSNTGWQAKAGAGFSIDAFTVDWDNQRVICPSGKASTQWGSQT